VEKAWEMVETRPEVEIIVHERNGAIHSNLLIRRHQQDEIDPDFLDDAEEESLRQEAMRITPSRAELHELIRRLPASSIDYSREDDDLPC